MCGRADPRQDGRCLSRGRSEKKMALPFRLVTTQGLSAQCSYEATVDAVRLDHDVGLFVSHCAGGGGFGRGGEGAGRSRQERLCEFGQSSDSGEEHREEGDEHGCRGSGAAKSSGTGGTADQSRVAQTALPRCRSRRAPQRAGEGNRAVQRQADAQHTPLRREKEARHVPLSAPVLVSQASGIIRNKKGVRPPKARGKARQRSTPKPD